MSDMGFLIRHALRIEFRNKHGIAGLVVFSLAAVYTCYQATGTRASMESWNALAWVVLLFAAFNAVSRPWADDSENMRSFLLHTVSPQSWILARVIYYGLLLSGLGLVVFLGFALFLGVDHFRGWNVLHFWVGIEATALALASLLSLLQALASRAGGGFGLVSVLGLPLMIPVILVSTRYGMDLMKGIVFWDTAHHLLFLASLTGGFVALGYILFPYLWRD